MNALSLFNLDSAPIPDAVPLTSYEKTLKAELEATIASGLDEFLRIGDALAMLRSKRLYREEFPSFEAYVRTKFALARSSADNLIRSAQTAGVLLEAGIKLPPNTSATLMRPITTLPGDELQVACWQFAQSLAPARGVTEPLISRLSRIIRNALDDPDPSEDDTQGNGGYHIRCGRKRARSRTSPEREIPFIRPIERLAAWRGFNVEIVISNVSPSSVETVYRACGAVVDRCREIQERLRTSFPELSQAQTPVGLDTTLSPDRASGDSRGTPGV